MTQKKLSRRVVAAVLASAGLLAAASVPAPAQDEASLEGRISGAREEIRSLAADLEAKHARLNQALSRAQSAAQRERQLSEQLATGRARAARLERRAEIAARRLEIAKRRLRRAVDQLERRVIAIYKSGEPDALTVILEADGFDDLITRMDYLREIENTDSRLVARVRALRAKVRRHLVEVRDLEAEVKAENRRLAAARAQIAEVKRRARAEAAELERARAEQAEAIAALRSRVDSMVAELTRLRSINEQQARNEVATMLGDFAIPKSIVLCESGGNYGALNPSSGAGGAYQILPSTWEMYGGKGNPEDAPKSEQDRIAAQIWADSGPAAWVCAG